MSLIPGWGTKIPPATGPKKSETIKHWKYMKNFLSIKEKFWDLLVVQWLILCLLMQGVWAWFPVGELRSHRPHGQKIKIKQKQYGNKFNKDFKTLKICEILPKRKIKIPSKQHGPGDTRNPGTAGLFPSMWESVSQGTLVMVLTSMATGWPDPPNFHCTSQKSALERRPGRYVGRSFTAATQKETPWQHRWWD